MKILHAYLRKNILVMTGLVVLMIAGLQTFISLITEMNSVGKGGYNALQAFYYVLLSLPHNLYPFFPIAALIGCLIALGRLASQSELLVMRTAGVSKVDVMLSVIRTTILMLIIATFIGEFLAPTFQEKAADYKEQTITQRPVNTAQSGGWIRDKQSFVHVNKVLADKTLKDILQYQFENNNLVLALSAKRAVYRNHQWELEDVAQTKFHTNKTTTQTYSTLKWDVTFDPDVMGLRKIETSQNNLYDIYLYTQYLKKGGLSASAYEFAFWKRLFQPLVTLVMIALAVPFIFGPLRTVTMGFRIMIGVIVGFGFYTFNEFLGPFSLVYQIPPFFAAALPIILFLLVDVYLFRRSS